MAKLLENSLKFIALMIDDRLIPRDYRDILGILYLDSQFNDTCKTLNVTKEDVSDRMEKVIQNYTKLTMTSKYIVLMAIRCMYRHGIGVPDYYKRDTSLGLELFLTKGIAKINDKRIINLVRIMIATDYLEN